MRKTLLVISGGEEAVPGIQRAKEMGLHVVVSDINPNAAGFAIADSRIIASTYDVVATVAAAQAYHRTICPINGVICIAADVPLTVASVAHALGLPGIPIEAAHRASDKLAMKQRFVEAGIAIPRFRPVESRSHLEAIVKDWGFPLVLKPVDSRGARGVLRLQAGIDLDWAFGHSQSYSPTSRVMVEEYLSGLQISTESFILNGRGFTPGFVDRNYEYLERFAPYMIENGGQQPSRLSPSDQQAVARLAEDAACAMGISTGIAKGDLVFTPDGPKVIEIAARLSGGWLSTDQIPLGTGVDLVGAAIKRALGEEVSEEAVTPLYHRGVAIRYFFPSPGRIVAIEHADAFADAPWVHRLGFFVRPGDKLEAVTDHTKRAGFVITTGKTSDEAVSRALQVIDAVCIRADPE